MTTRVKQFLAALAVTSTSPPPAQSGALVVVPVAPTPLELGADIRKRQAEIETAAIDVVSNAIAIGRSLRLAKSAVGHGNFEAFVAIECHLPMRTAQSYMRLARYEPKLAQLLASKSAGLAHLTMTDAFALINKLNAKPKPRSRSV